MSKSKKQLSPFRNHPTGAKLWQHVKTQGYACTATLPNPPDSLVGYSYTIGLCIRRFPELLIPDMHGDKAVKYLGWAASYMTDLGITLRGGETVMMPDGTEWQIRTHDPRDSLYTMLWTMRLLGDRHVVRAVRLVPPPAMRIRPGSLWPGIKGCLCGCSAPNPLAEITGQIGTSLLNS